MNKPIPTPENATGEWLIGSVESSIYWDAGAGFTQGSYAQGAYVTSEMAAGATSSLVFTPPAPGYYLIGAQIHVREGEESPDAGRPTVTLLLRDEEGEVIPNELEVQAKGYAWPCGVPFGLWELPVMGLWNLPAEPVTLTFQSGSPRFTFLDYFYLAPLFEARGSPSVFLPAILWPAEGDWVWGAAYGLGIYRHRYPWCRLLDGIPGASHR